MKLFDKTRHFAEKLLDIVPAVIEIGITSIDSKPGELSKLVDDKLKDLFAKKKTKKRSVKSPYPNQQMYKDIAEEHDAKVELTAYYKEQYNTKELEATKHRFINRLNEMYHIKDMQKTLDRER